MNSVAPLANRPSIVARSMPSTAVDLAVTCREAALTFVNDSPRWGKTELAGWLLGPYARLTGEARAPRAEAKAELSLDGGIDPRMLARVLKTARAEVLETLSRTRDPEAAASWVFASFASAFVIRCDDAYGTPAWLPTSSPRRLADRVLSLFVVDYLVRPFDYDAGPSFCMTCERVQVGMSACSGENCGRTFRTTFVAPRRPVATLPYTPEGA